MQSPKFNPFWFVFGMFSGMVSWMLHFFGWFNDSREVGPPFLDRPKGLPPAQLHRSHRSQELAAAAPAEGGPDSPRIRALTA